jgi:hypothetical protein
MLLSIARGLQVAILQDTRAHMIGPAQQHAVGLMKWPAGWQSSKPITVDQLGPKSMTSCAACCLVVATCCLSLQSSMLAAASVPLAAATVAHCCCYMPNHGARVLPALDTI